MGTASCRVPELSYRGAWRDQPRVGREAGGGRSGVFPVLPVPLDGLVCGQATLPLPDLIFPCPAAFQTLTSP